MGDLLGFFKIIQKTIGVQAIAFMVIAFACLAFKSQLGDKAPVGLSQATFVMAGLLFATGLLVAVLRLFAATFQHRPARGMIDGLAAGLFAGLLGGFFGYGYHTGPGYENQSSYYRILLCVVFAIPIAGVLGLCVDLFHPDRKIPWRDYLGAIVLSFAILFVFVGFGVSFFSPVVEGAGITLGDFQLIFEFGVAMLLAMMAFSFRWPVKRFLARSVLLISSIALARALTFLVYVEVPGQGNVRLCSRMFPKDLTGDVELAVSVIILMLWFIASYGAFFLNHPANRWLDEKLGRRAKPAN